MHTSLCFKCLLLVLIVSQIFPSPSSSLASISFANVDACFLSSNSVPPDTQRRFNGVEFSGIELGGLAIRKFRIPTVRVYEGLVGPLAEANPKRW